jgi:hypothetical protein
MRSGAGPVNRVASVIGPTKRTSLAGPASDISARLRACSGELAGAPIAAQHRARPVTADGNSDDRDAEREGGNHYSILFRAQAVCSFAWINEIGFLCSLTKTAAVKGPP